MNGKAAALLTRERLTAPHYLAYSWILDQLGGSPKRLLDFGARYSLLPTIATLAGHDVTAVDRDSQVVEWQAQHAREHGVKFPAYNWHPGSSDALNVDKFDFISACWCIQHNEPNLQGWLAFFLGRMLWPGGSLLIVSSLSDGESFHQANRDDPQWVLSRDDHRTQVIERSGLACVGWFPFWYQHATDMGGWCGPTTCNRPNAVAYRLTKGTA